MYIWQLKRIIIKIHLICINNPFIILNNKFSYNMDKIFDNFLS